MGTANGNLNFDIRVNTSFCPKNWHIAAGNVSETTLYYRCFMLQKLGGIRTVMGWRVQKKFPSRENSYKKKNSCMLSSIRPYSDAAPLMCRTQLMN